MSPSFLVKEKMSFSKHHQQNSSSQTLTLPEHLIFDQILHFLPAKSLFRFKFVSKSWFSTISAPEFVKLHLQFSSPGSQFLIHSSKTKTEILSLRYNESNCEIKDMGQLELCSLSINHYSVLNFVGSCDGLVCLVGYYLNPDVKLFIVWNPVTNQFRRIDFPEDDQQFLATYVCSFGYSSSRDDYLLFAVFWFDYSATAFCYMFSWSTGEWKLFDNLSNRIGWFDMLEGVYLIDDFVYFLYYCEIVGFSLANEEVNKSPAPLDWMETYAKFSAIRLRGRLCYICYGDYVSPSDDNVSDVWMLKRHCDWNSWEKLFSIDISSADYYGVSETGKCLVRHEGKLKVVDLSCGSGTLKLSSNGIDFDDIPHNKVVAHSYVESLVSPF